MSDLNVYNQNWLVESFRFTLFYPFDQTPLNDGLWSEITGEQPNSKTERPQEKLTAEEGPWDNSILSITRTPGRIDIVVSPIPITDTNLPNVGMLNTVMAKVSIMQNKFLFNNVTRVAFGLNILHPEKDDSVAYESLAKLLPDVTIKQGTRDFLYQFNIPVESSSHPACNINRLQIWGVIAVVLATIGSTIQKKIFATRLVLDINTDIDFIISDSESAKIFMKELVKSAFEITEGLSL